MYTLERKLNCVEQNSQADLCRTASGTSAKNAQEAGVSEAEIIRSCIDLYIGGITATPIDLAAWETEKEFIKEIKTRPVQVVGRDWQGEDLYER